MAAVRDLDGLRAIYGEPGDRAARKVLPRLDAHCRRFIGLSPFVLLATTGPDGLGDVTPRGDAPGFVTIADDATLLIPDRPGNNRLDSLRNIVARPGVGLLFVIPGVDETLRVAGTAEIRDDEALRAGFVIDGKMPKSVLAVAVKEAYLHCAKAFMRSRLWSPEAQVPRGALPSMGEMLRDQLALAAAETQAEMLERYRATLY
jgi:PPOX class probable FMN-dependent enzyme